MYNINIKNLRTDKPKEPYDVIVDRSSPLGNPYTMRSEGDRDRVCDMYKAYLDGRLPDFNSKQRKAFNRLLNIYEEYEQLNLFCWCTPKRCHAETIKNYLMNYMDNLAEYAEGLKRQEGESAIWN